MGCLPLEFAGPRMRHTRPFRSTAPVNLVTSAQQGKVARSGQPRAIAHSLSCTDRSEDLASVRMTGKRARLAEFSCLHAREIPSRSSRPR
eukprot:scaffold55745_cov66-Phaeocystis_antarctica.AAC.3